MKIQENLGETGSSPPQYEQNHHPNHHLLDQHSALKCNDQTIARVQNCPDIITLQSSGRVRVHVKVKKVVNVRVLRSITLCLNKDCQGSKKNISSGGKRHSYLME